MWSFLNTMGGIMRAGRLAVHVCVYPWEVVMLETTVRGYWVLSWYHNGTKSITFNRRKLENKWDQPTIWKWWRKWGLKRLSDLSQMTKQVSGRGRTKTQSSTLCPVLKPWAIMVFLQSRARLTSFWDSGRIRSESHIPDWNRSSVDF